MPLFDLPLDQLQRYAPEVREPPDFDAFWSSTLDSAGAAPPIVDVRPERTGLRLVDTWDVTFAGFAGDPVRAWFTRPAGCAPCCQRSWSSSATAAAVDSRTSV